jgi:flagellar basal-body rod protein FlgF
VDRLIYTSLTAMRGAQARQTATANNLANAQTPGFRGDIAEAQSLWVRGQGFESRAMASEEVVGADMRAGVVTETGRDLDVALENDAMLVVQADNGEEGYTRRGDLQLSASGLLTNGEGQPVMGTQGPITLPPADKIMIDGDGRISIVPVGGDPSQPQEVDRLRLVNASGSKIVKGMDGLFRIKGGGTLPDDPEARLATRHLEGSNVSATATLVKMIEASRAWDNQLKLISDAREMDSATADLMRLPE